MTIMETVYEDLRFIKDCFVFNIFFNIVKCRKLEQFNNIHKGDRCFIIATGPSLLLEDVDKLKDEYTFTVNSCFKIFDKTDWRPSYYVISDPQFINDMGDELKKYSEQIPCLFCGNNVALKGNNVYQYNVSKKYQNLPQKGFINKLTELLKDNFMSKNMAKGIISGHTVVFSALQIAEYMGFKEIYLLGTDCNYKGKLQYSELTPHTHINKPNAADLMMIDYLYAKRHFDRNNIKVYNATRGGMLEVFERVDFDKVIAERK